MKNLLPRSLALALIACAAFPAAAVPVRATFNGSVTGGLAFSTDVLSTFPVGTAASFDVTFDDEGLVPFAPVTDLDLAPVAGTVRLGALEWALDAGRITTYSYSGDPGFPILYYGLQLTGTGPLINTDDSLFGLFLRIAPSLAPSDVDPFLIGCRNPFVGGESYGYAKVAGTSSITREPVSVPEPGTLLLTSFALGLFWVRREGMRTRNG
jgi:hypothetical protein